MGTPLINFAAGGVPFPGNQIPDAAINPVARTSCNSIRWATCRRRSTGRRSSATNVLDSGRRTARLQRLAERSDLRALLVLGRPQHQPDLGAGTDVPGFPTRDDLATHAATLSNTHIFSPSLTNWCARRSCSFVFFFDQRLNRTPPSALGSATPRRTRWARGRRSSTSAATRRSAARSPDRATRRRTPSKCRTASPGRRRRTCSRWAASIRRTGIDMFQSIAPNAFFVFAGTFPTNNADGEPAAGRAGDVLPGPWRLRPSACASGARRCLRRTNGASASRADAELRPALRADQPVHRDRGSPERLRARACSRRSGPTRRSGLCFPAIRVSAMASRRAPTPSCRASGSRGIPTGPGVWSVRASYGIFYDQFQNGSGTASQVRSAQCRGRSSTSSAARASTSRIPYLGRPLSGARIRSSGRRRSSRSTRRRSRRRCRTGT